jgi:signal transduction histidine kinase
MDSFLMKVPLFADLPESDLEQLSRLVEHVHLATGDTLFEEGTPGDRVYVVQEGQLEVVKASSGREVLLAVRGPGEVIGEMALLEQTPHMATVRARTDSLLLAIHQDQLDRLLSDSPSAARAMFYIILGRWRATEAMLRQSEKMAQLGTLSAGVAHELNNPASAVKRGAEQLQDSIRQVQGAQSGLGRLILTQHQQELLESLARQARELADRLPDVDAITLSDRQEELEAWLEKRGADNAWEVAPSLASMGFVPSSLEALAQKFEDGQLLTVLSWLAATYAVHNLLAEIGQGAERLSEIVKALKSYTYLGQAPVQTVDVHEGLDNTLLILRHKLNTGIRVLREYAAGLPTIQAYGSELNQVWTNILDNAADALGSQGEIVIRTRQEGTDVIVEIEDNGPGIPPDAQARVFDPFFTTKAPGHGTGLGLHISYNIVVHKHRGDIKVTSQPGRTCFQVILPINFEAK